jgi:hypothetical protein
VKYQFHIVDVFTSSAFGGNQLAVVPEASGLSTEGMQKDRPRIQFRGVDVRSAAYKSEKHATGPHLHTKG